MTGDAMYKREDLKGSELKGFDAASDMHKTGCIYAVRQVFHDMPASAYANGGLKYVFNQLMMEAEQ